MEQVLGVEAVPLRQLREIALGAWEGKTRDELIAEFPELWAAWAREPDWDIVPGGEGAAPFERRVKAALVDLFSIHPGADVVVVTHGGVIQAALAGWSGVGRAACSRSSFTTHR